MRAKKRWEEGGSGRQREREGERGREEMKGG